MKQAFWFDIEVGYEAFPRSGGPFEDPEPPAASLGHVYDEAVKKVEGWLQHQPRVSLVKIRHESTSINMRRLSPDRFDRTVTFRFTVYAVGLPHDHTFKRLD